MGNITIKCTLDVQAMRALKTLAQSWSVSNSEVVRRAIRMAANKDSPNPRAALSALDQLQTSLRERNVDVTGSASDLKADH